MNRYDIPIEGNWATAILNAVRSAQDGDEIFVHSEAQETLANARIEKANKDITVTRRHVRWRRIIVPGHDGDVAYRLHEALKGDVRQ
jgi:hypothetical protein